jgi:uncharacterized protein (DUF302 family)
MSQGAARPYTISTTISLGYAPAVEAVRAALAEQGFGVLTEIDLAATMKAKLGKDIAPQVILGACRPPLAYEALQADPSVAALLPCNVVVRELDASTTLVEGFDPETMLAVSGSPALGKVAADAGQRLRAALDALHAVHGGPETGRLRGS